MYTGSQIRVLPVHVANKIAAGEVVERPAAVLKEIMENSLDAGATIIDVEVVAGGRTLLSVSDNGSGMSRDDALLSVERHATSKIHDVDDIENIQTMGFRGEALAAISSVSRFRLVTKREADETGTELVITGGRMVDVKDVGCPSGTTVEVRDLFHNVPARKKFLRSHQTELGHLRQTFLFLALGRPDVAMSLKVDGRDLLRLPANSGLGDRVVDFYGSDYRKALQAVEHQQDGISVKGYVGLPMHNRGDRSEQHIFVNGRAASAPVLGYALREGYYSTMPAGRHPIAFLFIDLACDRVDVNVHPTKREVRFRDGDMVRDAVIAAVRKAISQNASPAQPAKIVGPVGFEQAIAPSVDIARPPSHETMKLNIVDLPQSRTFTYPRLKMSPESTTVSGSAIVPSAAPTSDPLTCNAAPLSGAPVTPEAISPWAWCRVLGQIGELYVVLETEDGFAMMDPHAAHERVLFEKFMNEVVHGAVQTQALLLPETLELPPASASIVRKNIKLLKEIGFGIAEFGGDAFVLDALPARMASASPAMILPEIARELERAGGRSMEGHWREEAVASAACKAAVKANDRLKLAEIEQLVIDLAKSEMPYTCPHGRPTMIFTSYRDLHRKFGRE
jgi:DNA mismatch repair protein MutL